MEVFVYYTSGFSFVCYSEKLFRTMTDLVISEGYAAAGYEYINVDDCWLDFARSYDGRLQPDAKRFPRGMADLSEYVSTRLTVVIIIIVLRFANKKILVFTNICSPFLRESVAISPSRFEIIFKTIF